MHSISTTWAPPVQPCQLINVVMRLRLITIVDELLRGVLNARHALGTTAALDLSMDQGIFDAFVLFVSYACFCWRFVLVGEAKLGVVSVGGALGLVRGRKRASAGAS